MEDECDSIDVIRDAYERAIANVPPLAEKRSWRRYIYLWINYAIFEELQAKVGTETTYLTCSFVMLVIIFRHRDFISEY